MSETKHTPGPWKPSTDYRLRSIDIVPWNAQGESIAKIKTGMPTGDGEAIANARLIAAAPELLAACHLAHVRLTAGNLAEQAFNKSIADRIESAISKAEGSG